MPGRCLPRVVDELTVCRVTISEAGATTPIATVATGSNDDLVLATAIAASVADIRRPSRTIYDEVRSVEEVARELLGRPDLVEVFRPSWRRRGKPNAQVGKRAQRSSRPGAAQASSAEPRGPAVLMTSPSWLPSTMPEF
jgi:hypothetical protein